MISVLVVIDLQIKFAASTLVLEAAKKEILRAIALKMPIVILQCDTDYFGETHSCLTDLLKDYDTLRHIVLTKQDVGQLAGATNGGPQVKEAIDLLGFPTDCFRLCGVNTEICVFFTALELSRLYPFSRIELVQDACASQYCEKEREWVSFAYYAQFHNMATYSLV